MALAQAGGRRGWGAGASTVVLMVARAAAAGNADSGSVKMLEERPGVCVVVVAVVLDKSPGNG